MKIKQDHRRHLEAMGSDPDRKTADGLTPHEAGLLGEMHSLLELIRDSYPVEIALQVNKTKGSALTRKRMEYILGASKEARRRMKCAVEGRPWTE